MKIIGHDFKIVEVRPKKKFYYLGETWAVVPYTSKLGGGAFIQNKIVHFDTGISIPLHTNGETMAAFIIRAENLIRSRWEQLGSEEFKAEINKHTKIN